MAYAVTGQALASQHGWMDIPILMYLDPTDYGYELHYIDVPDFTGAVYKGKVDKLGNPVNQEEYDLWVSKLPQKKQLNPFHTHFIHPEIENITAEKIKAQMDFHLPNFYEAWKAGKTIRSGWDTNTRTAPTKYDREMTKEQFAVRQRLVLQKVKEFAVVSKSVELTGGKTFHATAIDVGPGATDRATTWLPNNYTLIDLANPANDTGILDTFEVWFDSSCTSGFEMGTFSGSGTDYNDRDYFLWGAVTGGSKQTSTGQSVDVSSGDYLGCFKPASGGIRRATTGGSGIYYVAGDKFGSGSATYTAAADDVISIYATGDTGGGATIYPIWRSIGSGIGIGIH